MLEVRCFQVGYLATNCYVIKDKDSGRLAVVDPGYKSDALVDCILQEGKDKVDFILLTHGHFDHIAFAQDIRELTGAKILVSKSDEPFLLNPQLNLSSNFSFAVTVNGGADKVLLNGESFKLGNTELEFILTPGHTQGSGCFVAVDDKIIFSGDTLFKESMGRTDFVTGDPLKMFSSLKKLSQLEGDYIVYPGHNEPTTLEHERNFNPYMR